MNSSYLYISALCIYAQIKNIHVQFNFIHIIKNIFKTLETPLKIQINLILFTIFFFTYMRILYGILTLELTKKINVIKFVGGNKARFETFSFKHPLI